MECYKIDCNRLILNDLLNFWVSQTSQEIFPDSRSDTAFRTIQIANKIILESAALAFIVHMFDQIFIKNDLITPESLANIESCIQSRFRPLDSY